MKRLRVSVIITCYNSKEYTEDLVRSLAIQTLQPFEVVIVDDCSPRSDIEALESQICMLGLSCKVIRLSQNSGSPSRPRNIGIERASGDYIAFLDQDDVWDPCHLEDSTSFLVLNKVGLVSSGYYIFGKNTRVKRIFRPKEQRITQARLRQQGNMLVLSSVVARREILRLYRFRDDLRWEDFELWYRLGGDREVVMHTLACVNVGYRISRGSRSDGLEKTLEGLREVKTYMGMKSLIYSRWYIVTCVKVSIRRLMCKLGV